MLVSGEIAVRVRPGGRPERLLHDLAPGFEMQGLEVIELEERRLAFVVDVERTRAAGNEMEILREGQLFLVHRAGGWVVRYVLQADGSRAGWIYPGCLIVLLLAMIFGTGLRIRFVGGLSLPALSAATLGSRSAIRRVARRFLAESIDAQPGLDCDLEQPSYDRQPRAGRRGRSPGGNREEDR